jgi:hypothetical protein
LRWHFNMTQASPSEKPVAEGNEFYLRTNPIHEVRS